MKTVLFGAGLLAVVVCSCAPFLQNRITGSGHLVTTNVIASGFQNVEASGTFHVSIQPGPQYSVKITTDDNIFDKLSIEQDGSWLRLGLKSGYGINPTKLRAEVTMPRLDGVSARGATKVDFGLFKIVRLSANVSGASAVRGDLNAGAVRIYCSGASKLTLAGTAGEVDLTASGASAVEGGGLMAERADVNLSGASKANLRVAGELNYDVSGASNFKYSGQPKIGRRECSGASSAHQW